MTKIVDIPVEVVATPEQDGKHFNNQAKAYVRRSYEQLGPLAAAVVENAIERARHHAEVNGFTSVTGRIDLMRLRSDEVRDFTNLAIKLITDQVADTHSVIFIYYENTDTTKSAVYQSMTVRDLTFVATPV